MILAILGAAPVLAQDTFRDPIPEDFVDFVGFITNPLTPLLSCDAVGVSEALGCVALCEAVSGGGVDLQNTRDRNGDYTCSCDDLVACSDQPTCEQLLITPGNVEASCGTICGDQFLAFKDEVQYAGGIANANKNQTQFIVECRCGGVTECSDFLLFSDLSRPIPCTALEIDDAETCREYCLQEGGDLFISFNLALTERPDGTFKSCICGGNDNDGVFQSAEACSDIPQPEGPEACTLKDPCPTPAPTESGASPMIWTNVVLVSLQRLIVFVTLAIL